MKKTKLFTPNRPVATKKFNINSHIDAMYDSAWERYSKEFLSENSICYACGRKSEAVDHIIAHKGDIDKFKSLTNHLPLCHKCHNTVTTLFDRHVKPKTQEKLKWLHANRLRNSVTVRVKVLPKYLV